jgi:hypothetical protein
MAGDGSKRRMRWGNAGGETPPRALLAVLATSLLLKLALLVPAHSTEPFFDALDYVAAALGLVRDGAFNSLRAPGYPAFMAAVLWVGRLVGLPLPQGTALLPADAGVNGFDLVRLVQVLVSTATVVLLYRVAREFFDRRAAVAAAAVIAFYPNLVAYSHLLWTETLFMFLVLWGLLLAIRTSGSRSAATAVGCGLVLGVSALTRQIGLVVVVVVAVWVILDVMTNHQGIRMTWPSPTERREFGGAARLSAAIVIAAALTVLPWTARNFVQHGEVVLISASGGVGLLFGATDDPMGEIRAMNDPDLRFDGLKRDRRCGERAREIIAADPAGWVARCLTHNIPSLFQPVFDGLITHLLAPNKGYGVLPAWLVRTLLILLLAAYAVLAVTAIAGAWLAGERRYTLLFVGLMVAYLAAHTTILGVTRHRLPLEILAAVFAGFTLTRTWAELRRAASPLRLAGIAVCLLLLGGVIALSPVDRAAGFWTRAAIVAEQR